MGCDIHLTAEFRDKATGQWVSRDIVVDKDYVELGEPDYLTTRTKNDTYGDRNYYLFAILANVRNGHGFAGVKTGEGFNPIAMPRGIPDDATDIYKRFVEQWGMDGHSHSYFTLDELLAYDWTQTSKLQGYVDLKEWAEAVTRGYGVPNNYSSMVSGGRVTHHTPEQFEAAWQSYRAEKKWPEQRRPWHLKDDELEELRKHVEGQKGSPHALMHWEQPYYEAAGNFWLRAMPILCSLGKPDDVRICFFFDN